MNQQSQSGADTDLNLRIENVRAGLRNYGYRVTMQSMPGCEREFYEALRDCLARLDNDADFFRAHYRCRGRSKRLLAILHRNVPEPCWGVNV